MHNKAEAINNLRRAMEFYQGLGFEYLPLKNSNMTGLAAETVKEAPVLYVKSEEPVIYIANKDKAIQKIRDEISDCQRCKLSKGRKNIVFGEGDSDARLMFIGEGPGREEDVQGRPFVGDAGEVLTKLIVKMGLKREDVYIANIVKCRPPMNRDPEEDETASCSPFLEKQIDVISPEIIITLGRISSQKLLGTTTPISRLRGTFLNYRNIPVMPTFHPAYLLRNPKAKWDTWDDVQKVLEKLKDKGEVS